MDFNSFNNFAQSGASEEGVSARFYDRTVKTERIDAQGFPVFAEVCFCEIRLKDNVSEIFDQPASIDKIRRFPREYALYQQQRRQAAEGTPLEQFAFLSKPEIEALKARGIYSVENLSALDDEKANALGIAKERAQARKFIEQARDNRCIEEWRRKEERYRARIASLEEDVAVLRRAAVKRENILKGEKS